MFRPNRYLIHILLSFTLSTFVFAGNTPVINQATAECWFSTLLKSTPDTRISINPETGGLITLIEISENFMTIKHEYNRRDDTKSVAYWMLRYNHGNLISYALISHTIEPTKLPFSY